MLKFRLNNLNSYKRFIFKQLYFIYVKNDIKVINLEKLSALLIKKIINI